MDKLKDSSDTRVQRTCGNCRRNSISNIDILSFSEGAVFDKKIVTTSLFFILEGPVEVNCGLISELIVEKNYFFLIPPGAKYSIRFLEDGKMVWFQPGEELLVEYISKTSYELYKTKCAQYENRDIFFLEIEKHIARLLTDFLEVRSKKFSCDRYICCKCEELLILLVNYYPAEELAWLFHPIFERKVIFKSIVLLHRNKLFTVDEFAAVTHLSRETFRQHFRETFRTTPAKWIQKERADSVYRELAETNKPMQDIIQDHGFANFPNFARFCNMYLKKTPMAIRNQEIDPEKEQSQPESVQIDKNILPK